MNAAIFLHQRHNKPIDFEKHNFIDIHAWNLVENYKPIYAQHKCSQTQILVANHAKTHQE